MNNTKNNTLTAVVNALQAARPHYIIRPYSKIPSMVLCYYGLLGAYVDASAAQWWAKDTDIETIAGVFADKLDHTLEAAWQSLPTRGHTATHGYLIGDPVEGVAVKVAPWLKPLYSPGGRVALTLPDGSVITAPIHVHETPAVTVWHAYNMASHTLRVYTEANESGQ